ncbi:MAG: DUF6445 family protein [Pseudomonadota bacterium]
MTKLTAQHFAPGRASQTGWIQIGPSGEHVLVIDDMLAEPGHLRDHACREAQFSAADTNGQGYPGLRAPLPTAYARAMLNRLDPLIREKFALAERRIDRFNCGLSMVTRARDALHPLQRVPHIDIARNHRIAILHYLFDRPYGGTAFYRQEATGLERVGTADKQRYLDQREQDIALLEPHHSYPDADTPGYSRLLVVPARMNRVIIYRSCVLHSGVIMPAPELTDNPETGRLTANFFVDYA